MGLNAAYHEAGHAVAALRLCHSWSAVSLDEHGGGVASFRLWNQTREISIRGAAAFVAGPIAEAMYSGEPVTVEAGDLAELDELTARFPDPRFLAVAERLARRTIRRHWCEVERVALALVEQRYLTPMDLAGIVGRRAV